MGESSQSPWDGLSAEQDAVTMWNPVAYRLVGVTPRIACASCIDAHNDRLGSHVSLRYLRGNRHDAPARPERLVL
jgi:hypothetical protein